MTKTAETEVRPYQPAGYIRALDIGADDLSPREREVLELISAGLSNQEIAETLYLSINSVKTYIRTSYRKIGVERRSQAVLWAVQHGLLKIPGVTITVDREIAPGAAA